MAMARAFGAALRNLGRAPAFTGLVVLTLALGIGSTTAMFSVVDAVLLNPLPYPNADRFGAIWTSYETRSPSPGTTAAAALTLRRQTDLFTAVEGYQFGSVNITGDGDPEIVGSPQLTPGLLGVLGVAPAHGRLFTDEDAATGRVALISHHLFAVRFGSDPSIVGRDIVLDDEPHRIIGVMPPHFRFPEANARVWRPLNLVAGSKPGRFQVISVRRPELTLDQLNERLRGLTPELRASAAIGKAESLYSGLLIQQTFGREANQALYLLFGAVCLVLLVACVNVMNLLLSRASSRARELAVMTALGATRGALIKSVLLESVVLAAAGCVAGLAVARALLDVILAAAPENLTFLTGATSQLDWRALSFAAALAVITCVIFGLMPAWRAARVDAIETLKQRAASASATDDWWQGTLVASQLALVVVLLVGAGLLLRSFDRLVRVNPGFDVDHLAVMVVQLPGHRYGAPGAGLAFMQELERNVEAAGGATAAISGGAPPRGGGISFDLHPELDDGSKVDLTKVSLPFTAVMPDYFAAMDIPVLAGRTFAADDPRDSVIVNDVMARRFFGDAPPIGRRFRLESNRPWLTVVGVAGDVKQMGPSDPIGDGMEFYRPYQREGRDSYFALVVRSTADPSAILPMVRQQVWRIDPKLPIVEADTMEARIGEAIARPRFYLALSSAFAVSGVLLAAIGVYGVSSYWVSRRRRELAIRMALGATREHVMGMVIGRSVKLAALGAVTGLALAVAGARAIQAMLFQVDSRDPVTLALVTAALALLVIAGCIGPALRASRVDPMTTLRAE